MQENRKSRFGAIPVQEGQEYDVEIEGIGEKGDGIAKINGYVVIVPNVQKGDRVKVKVNAVRGKVSFAEVIGEATSEPETDAPQEESQESEEMDEASEDSEESGEAEESKEEDSKESEKAEEDSEESKEADDSKESEEDKSDEGNDTDEKPKEE